jgi:hypothetical protein
MMSKKHLIRKAKAEPAVPKRANGNDSPLQRVVTESPSFVSLYANDAQIQTSPWDIRIVFGTIKELPSVEHPTITIAKVAEIHMSPQLAKRLSTIMQQQVRRYEETIGEIPTPSSE